MRMKTVFTISALAFSLAVTTSMNLALAEAGVVPSAGEQKYLNLAARIVATADACTALEVIDPGIGFLDEITVGLMDLGASEEEATEWVSNQIANKSPAIQSILAAESEDGVWLQCTRDLDDKRQELEALREEALN